LKSALFQDSDGHFNYPVGFVSDKINLTSSLRLDALIYYQIDLNADAGAAARVIFL
jgi:hypothetical protein